MKFKVIDNAWWMFWAKGMVLWPWMWMKYTNIQSNPTSAYEEAKAKQDEAWNKRLFRHELEHCYQIRREGRLKFYSTYIWYQLKYGYEKNPYEVEAREVEHDALTYEELYWYHSNEVQL